MPDVDSSHPKLPSAPAPQGRYAPAVVHAGIAYSAGMTPRSGGELLVRGRVGAEVTPESARELAGIAATNALSAVADAVGGLERIARCLHMTVFIAAGPGFADHAGVADGASHSLLAALGDRGTVARAAVGVASLPSGAPVEVMLTAAVDTEPATEKLP